MDYTFNLIDQPWIPCVMLDGTAVEVSLRDMLVHAHEIRTIAAETPLINTAILPVALAVLHRMFGPKNRSAWEDLWEGGAFPFEPLDGYFTQWYDRFDLFHPERPFYQVADERVKPKSVIHLIHSIGNTGTLFTHMNDEQGLSLTFGAAARYLLTAQTFRTAGLSGLPEKFTDSTFTRGVLFWADGDTLFEQLMLNLMPYPSKLVPIAYTESDKPFWEQDDPFQKRAYPYGYLDYLTWPSNRILLMPEGDSVSQMTIAPGLHLAGDVQSPQKRYRSREKKGEITWSFLYFNPDKGLWRDYHTLLTLDSEDVKPPAVVDWLARLALDDVFDDVGSPRIAAVGMLADQAKPIFYRQETMTLPVGLLRNAYDTRFIGEAIDQAEQIARDLNDALGRLARRVLMRDSEQEPDPNAKTALVKQWDVISLYWMQLEPAFWYFIDVLTKDPDAALDEWETILRDAARSALDAASNMAGTSTAALRGRVEAERLLNGKVKTLFDKGGKKSS